MQLIFFIIILFHGFIHLLGFIKAYELASIAQLTQSVSRPAGILWLLTTMLFIASALCFIFNYEYWWSIGITAIIISQILIIFSWSDAKYGTIVNIIILIPLIVSFMNSLPSSFQNRYAFEVHRGLVRFSESPLMKEEDILRLPIPIQRYLRYFGIIGKPRVQNFRATFKGQIKPMIKSDWLEFSSQQYDFFDEPSRIFFIKSKMFGIPFDGLHMYIDSNATMQIKVASLFQVADGKGPIMTASETVTLFNDMCILAPASLVDKNIQWKTIDSTTVKATYMNKGNTISAMLYFNDKGELINFVSDDRYQSEDSVTYKKLHWSTPIKDYKSINGHNIASYGEVIWSAPEGDFTYGKFSLEDIEYNCKNE